ncbi:MAG: MFS transporter [Acidimicrobiia bacterium]|nr:MFS transporter [Acidimicrobiia bacterium]
MTAHSGRTQLGLVFLVAGAALTGVQAILPALPAVQTELGLNDSEVALVTSLYFLPSVLFAAPLGFLTDRVGRRAVISVALAVFGIAGVVLAFGTRSLPLLLSLRFVQGATVAAVLPLTITLIGDLKTGTEQVASQGHRSVAMCVAGAVFPVVGGAMVAIAWSALFALQAIGLALALACWFVVPDPPASSSVDRKGSLWRLIQFVRQPAVLALQGTTFSRFFFKFAFLTYLPVLLVSKRGMTEGFAGLALGVFATSGLVALLAGRLALRLPPSRWIGVSLLAFGASLALLAVDLGQVTVIAIAVLFGLADGIFGVFVNAFTAGITSSDLRATFVATSGMVRNTGKLLAPTILGVMVLWLRLETAFVIVGVVAFLALALVPPLHQFDADFRDHQRLAG